MNTTSGPLPSPVPLPSDAEADLLPPDAAQVRTVMRGLIAAVSGPGGPTELQQILLRAVVRSMTGVDVDPAGLDGLDAAGLAAALRRRDREYRTRIVHLMLLGELVLIPGQPAVSDQVDAYAAALSIDDGMLAVARDLATGALDLALTDFDRNGYTSGWDPAHHANLHARGRLSQPWEFVSADPELAAEWARLAECGHGTLGLGVYRFYQARGFTFPGLPGSAPPYLAQHDWVHVLAGYGTTVESELEVFGLIGRAVPKARGFSLLAQVIGLFETGQVTHAMGLFDSDTGHLARAGMATRLGDAMRRGALCGQDLMEVDWFELADRPVSEVRARFGITAKSPEAIAAGSVGPFQPGGISPFQLASGRRLAEAEDRRYDTYGATPPP